MHQISSKGQNKDKISYISQPKSIFWKQAFPAKRPWRRVLKMHCDTEMSRVKADVYERVSRDMNEDESWLYINTSCSSQGVEVVPFHMRQTWREKGVAFSTNTHTFTLMWCHVQTACQRSLRGIVQPKMWIKTFIWVIFLMQNYHIASEDMKYIWNTVHSLYAVLY